MSKECKKCDVNGMIKTSKYESKSCDCGKHNRLMGKAFEGQTLEKLFIYGLVRKAEKGGIIKSQ